MKRILTAIFSLFVMLSLHAQQLQTITGRVSDEKGEAVPFATVTETGTRNAVKANASGAFTIKVKPGAQLTFTSSGFASKTVASREATSVVLTQSDAAMTEVVVTTALGVQRQAKELGYSTARIRAAELTQGRAVNLQQGLAGKVSGLNITTTNNSVFENTKINFRGLRSLTGNNQPLLVVDGIPTPLSYISSINPNDVQDVNLLKGASAAAIYGPDGVNGVIIVNTRKGTRAAPIITFSSSYQLNRVSYMPERQRDFGMGSSVDNFGRPLYDPLENYSYGDRFDGSLRPVGRQLEDGTYQMIPYAATKEDQQVKFWNEHGAVLQNDLSFSTQDYYISMQDALVKGLVPKDQNRRMSFRFNAAKSYEKFRSSFNINYIQSNYNIMDQAGYASRFPAYNGSIYSLILQTAANIPLTEYKDWRNSKYAQYSNYYNEYATNPYWSIDNHRSIGRNDDLLGSLELKYDFATWLQATGRIGANFSFGSYKNQEAPIFVSDYADLNRSGTTYSNRPGYVADGQSFSSRTNAEFFLSGKRDVKDFGITYLAGTQWREDQSKQMNIRGNNLVVPYLYNVANRTGEIAPVGPGIPIEANIKNRLISVFGSLAFSYKGWANLEVVGRNDWNSRLNPDNNSYFYPGVNASLVLSDALEGIKNSSWISYLKLRGSLTKSGNVNLGTYALAETYSNAGGFPYGNLPGFTADDRVPDPNIRPEFVKSKEAGIELGFLKNRISVEATYFHQRNTDQILAVQTSAATGYTSKVANTADFENYGLEFDLRLTPLVNLGKAKLDLKFNATFNDNKILRLSDNVNELSIGGSTSFVQLKASAPNVYNYAIVGQPAFVFKLTDYERDPEGRVIVDANGNPTLSDSLVTRGRAVPTLILGINPNFSWKGLTVGMTWDYKGGHHVYHGLGTDMDGYGISKRSTQFNRERFVFPNSVYFDGTKYVPNTDRQVSGTGINFWGTDVYNTGIGTNYFTSAASWKLRELLIAYDLPAGVLGGQKVIKKATISFVGRNLLTFLPKSNQWSDPEFNYSSSNNTFGLSSVYQTPPVRTFGGSVTLTF